MNNNALSFLVLLAVTPALRGQDAGAHAAAAPLPTKVPVHQVLDDAGRPAGLWAATDSYKAGFADGMTFVPYLGAEYPENQSFAWRTVRIAVGACEVVGPAGAPTAVVCAPDRVEYRHGDVVEAYDVRADGLEQTFVFARRPEGSGDLVVTGAAVTAVAPAGSEEGHQALTFVDGSGRPIFTYGAATAIDGRGQRFPMTTRWHDGVISLRLPAAALAAATFPLVVDPLLARAPHAYGSNQGPVEVDVAVQTESVSWRCMMAYSRYASAADADVFAMLCTGGMAVSTTVFSALDPGSSAARPRCAYVAGADRWVLAFQQYVPSSDLSRIRVHVHDRDDLTARTGSVGLLNLAGVHDWRPDVGGTLANSTGVHALLVFQRENGVTGFQNEATSSIMVALFDASTPSGTFGVPLQLSSTSGNIDCEFPSVNQTAEGGASFSWVCAYQQYDNAIGNDDWDVIVRRIDRSGSVTSGQWLSDVAGQGRHQLGPIVEGLGGRYAVTFATIDLASGGGKTTLRTGKDVRLERFDWPHGQSSPAPANWLPTTLHQAPARIWEATGLAFDVQTRSHWAPAFRAVAPGVPAGYIARTGYRGRVTEGPLVLHTALDLGEVACSYDAALGYVACAYAAEDAQAVVIYGQCLAHTVPPVPNLTGTACSSVALGWAGPAAVPALDQHVGSEFTELVASSAAADHTHVVALAVNAVDQPLALPFVEAGCHLLVPLTGPYFVTLLPVQVGANPRWPLPLPEHLANGTTLYFQDWTYAPSTGRFSATHRLRVILAK